jgi:hypothetical protein
MNVELRNSGSKCMSTAWMCNGPREVEQRKTHPVTTSFGLFSILFRIQLALRSAFHYPIL